MVYQYWIVRKCAFCLNITLDDQENQRKITSANMGLICSYIGNGFDAFEGDIMMAADQWEEMKRDFKRTGQPVP